MTNEPSAAPSDERIVSAAPASGSPPQFGFPKQRRLLKPSEFRHVYDNGFRVPSACFVAFCLKGDAADGPKLGFTTTRALGKSTVRNRMKRRVRETIRRRLAQLGPHWRIVWNLRRASLAAPQAVLDSEVERVFRRCKD